MDCRARARQSIQQLKDTRMTQNVFSVKDGATWLNGKPLVVRGLRCSNSLVSDVATADLITHLDLYKSYGVNTVSVFLMGSRFGDIKGYREDASLDPAVCTRLACLIEAADQRGMVILVGCLYWSTSQAKWPSWTQAEANLAVSNTVQWLKDHDYRNTFVDVDNEGMARAAVGFDNRAMVLAGKAVDERIPIATNYHGAPPPEADLAIHHSDEAPGKPYIESEGSPDVVPYGKGYWGTYSKAEGLYAYINVGVYTEEMKHNQIEISRQHFNQGKGYMLASTWLQAAPRRDPTTILAAWAT
jgi:hypothetical protein